MWLKAQFWWKKSVGGFLTYDVIAPWPDLTRSFFRQKWIKGCLISSAAKFERNPPSDLMAISENSLGVASPLPVPMSVKADDASLLDSKA